MNLYSILALGLTLTLSPSFAHADGDKIQIGTSEMTALFSSLGVKYLRTYDFAQIFYSYPKQSLPGSDLSFKRSHKINEFFLRTYKIINSKDLPERLSAYLKPIPQIAGYGLYAGREYTQSEILGIYSGEVAYQPSGNMKIFVPLWIHERHPDYFEGSEMFEKGRPYIFGSSYLNNSTWLANTRNSFLIPYAPTHPRTETSPIVINAEKAGNETRFINHAAPEKANCGFKYALISYKEFLLLSGQTASVEKVTPEVYIIVVLVVTTKEISKDQPFLVDYGESYWEKLGLSPLDLSDL